VSLLSNFALAIITLAVCVVLFILCLAWLLLFRVQIALLEQTASLLRTCMTEPVLLSELTTERTSTTSSSSDNTITTPNKRQSDSKQDDATISKPMTLADMKPKAKQTPTAQAISSTGVHSAPIPHPPLVESSKSADTAAVSTPVIKQVESKLKTNPFANNVAGLAEAKSFSADMKIPKTWGRTTPQTASSHRPKVSNAPIAPQKKLGDAPTNVPARTSTGNNPIPPHMRVLMAAKEAKQSTAGGDATKIMANVPSTSRSQDKHVQQPLPMETHPTATMDNLPLQQHPIAKSGRDAVHQQQPPACQPASTHVPCISAGAKVADPLQVPLLMGFGIDNRQTTRTPPRPTSSELSPTAPAFVVPFKPSSEGMSSAREASSAVQTITSTHLSRPPQFDSRIADLPSPDLMAYRIAAGSQSLLPAPHSLQKLFRPSYDVAPAISEVPIARRASLAIPIKKPATTILPSTDPFTNPPLVKAHQKNVAVSRPPGLGSPQKNVQAAFDALIDVSEVSDEGQQKQNVDPQRQSSASFKASPMLVLKPETPDQGAHHAQSDQKFTADFAPLVDSAKTSADEVSAPIITNKENTPPTVAQKPDVQAYDDLSTPSDQDPDEKIPTLDDPTSNSPDEASASVVPNKTKSEIKEMKKNARVALADAWFEREEVRNKVTSNYKLEDMMQLQDLTNTYSQRRQSLQDLMSNGVLNDDDATMFPVIAARNLAKPKQRPEGLAEWRERRVSSKNDAKAKDRASHDDNGESEDIDDSKVLIGKMEKAKILRQNSLDYFKQRPQTNVSYSVWKQKGEAANDRASKFYNVKLRALKAHFPQGLPPDLVEKYPEIS
jgi:hypothetical protein